MVNPALYTGIKLSEADFAILPAVPALRRAIISTNRVYGESLLMSAVASELHLKMPPGFADAVHLTDSELQQHILLMAALKMFELGKVSSGKAAELAGLSRVDFFEKCGQYKVSIFNYSVDKIGVELQTDLDTLNKIAL